MRRHIIATVVAVLAAGSVTSAPPAVASPAYDDPATKLAGDSGFDADGSGCTEDPAPATPSQVVPLAENGAPVTLSVQSSGTGHGTVPTDRVAGSASATVTGQVTSAAGLPRSFDMSVTGQATMSSQQPTSVCVPRVYAGGQIGVGVTLVQPMWLHLQMASDDHIYNEVSFYRVDDGDYHLEFTSYRVRNERAYRYLLPAGKYAGYFGGQVQLEDARPASVSASGTVHGTFALPGSLTAPAAGKGRAYVTLPPAASCVSHGLDPVVTAKGKRAQKIKQLELFLDDVRVVRLKHPKKGKAVHLPVVPGAAVALRAEVTLVPKAKGKAKGKKPRTVTATASYEACP